MGGRVYTVQFENVSVSAIQDFFEIRPASNKPVDIIGLFLSQAGAADVGDAQEECLRIAIIRGFTSSGSGGSTPTPAPVKRTDAAAGFAAETNNTTVATTGTTVQTHSDSFNVRIGYQNWWPPGTETDCTATDTSVVVRLIAAPADAILLTGTLYVQENG